MVRLTLPLPEMVVVAVFPVLVVAGAVHLPVLPAMAALVPEAKSG